MAGKEAGMKIKVGDIVESNGFIYKAVSEPKIHHGNDCESFGAVRYIKTKGTFSKTVTGLSPCNSIAVESR
jgi:hypothetical protein